MQFDRVTVALLVLRLVKRNVNQDDPGTCHWFYADHVCTSGTDFTFFPWPQMEPGRLGAALPIEIDSPLLVASQ
jgi:glyoxalase family protein